MRSKNLEDDEKTYLGQDMEINESNRKHVILGGRKYKSDVRNY